jgi:Uma2 family endonuclease
MATPAGSFFTPQEYLDLERQATHKSEYLNGQIFAMCGAIPQHNTISTNTIVTLHRQVAPKGCQVYGSDMKVRVESTNLYTYPDVSVACGKPRFDADEMGILLNPVLIVEIPSPTTERYDRVGKFAMYSGITSLREYVLISQSAVKVERSLRRPGGKWLLTEAERMMAFLLEARYDVRNPKFVWLKPKLVAIPCGW